MSYKLFIDKQEVFECKIYLEGVALSAATSRILVETQDLKLLFEGTIDKDGNCKVPIKKLRGLLGEETKGTIKLEVIADDTYFMPWESDFIVDASKKIKVEVKQQSKPLVKDSKPKMVVEKIKNFRDPVEIAVNRLHKKGVTIPNIYKSKATLVPMLEQYAVRSGYRKGKKAFIREVINRLSKKH